MAQTEAARAEAFAKQADRSREFAAGYVQQALENANAIRKTKALFDNALATIGIPHRWNGTTLELVNPVTGEWVAGPDLRGSDAPRIIDGAFLENDHLVFTFDNTETLDVGVGRMGGDVRGPESVTSGNPAVFDATTGKLIKEITFAAFKTALALVKADVGLGNVDNTSDTDKNAAAGTLTNKTIDAALNTLSNIATSMFAANVIDTDGALAANSDTRLASQKATKTYVDGIVEAANALQYKGTLACAANPNYPAANAGHMYIVSSAGRIGGASGTTVDVGDAIFCKTDSTAAGTQAAVGAQWDILQFNLVGALTAADIGSTVQAYSAILAAFIALTGSNDDVLQWKSGAVARRTPVQLMADLPAVVGDSGAGGTKGAVPAPGAGDAAAAKFLKADGTWALPNSGAVEVVSATTLGANAASVSFTGIAATGYSKHILVLENVVSSNASGTEYIAVHVSTDNGATWKTSSGDYMASGAPKASISADASSNTRIIDSASTFKKQYLELDLVGLGNANCATSCFRKQEMAATSTASISLSGITVCGIRPVAEADNAIRVTPVNGAQFLAGSKFTLLRVKS